MKSLNKGSNSNKYVALTFDDGPAEYTETILDILNRTNVTAAFFCIGKRIDSNHELVKRIHEDGHIIGNHSYNHGFMFDWQSSKKMTDDINRANDSIFKLIDKKPLLFRPPYGITNPNLSRAIKATNMYSIGWALRSYDTTTKDATKLKERILNNLTSGDVILLHDSMAITAEILTDLIASTKQKGFTFVGIDELFGIEAYA